MLLFLLLCPSLVNPYIMPLNWKKVFLLIFWMGVASGTVILFDYLLPIPDEISGVLYFLSIGIAVSTVLNYYQKT
ncbi:MAG: hypothetical protein CM15mP87_10760 [Candidatus Neomarinimicrobiota bacterium]|nr:MAG: hypothetical protein CM15mP87_10760 [Candidatus Neomarinimicrobiota bacterium]